MLDTDTPEAALNLGLPPAGAPVEIADVVIAADVPDLLPTYSYRVPSQLADALPVGSCVHVPFGAQEHVGYVMERRTVAPDDPLCKRLRDVIAPIEGAVTFSEAQADLARWLAERYVCRLPDAVRCVAPAIMSSRVIATVRLVDDAPAPQKTGAQILQAHLVETLRELGGEAPVDALKRATAVTAFRPAYAALIRKGVFVETRGISRAKTVTRTVRGYVLGDPDALVDRRVSSAGRRIVDALAELHRQRETLVTTDRLLEAAHASTAALRTLVASGAVVARDVPVRRSPTSTTGQRTEAPPLTTGQQAAASAIGEMIAQGASGTALLYGVTASGKTEVYLDAIDRTLTAGRTAMVLVPEIALTAQVVRIFTGRFGDDVAVLHSAMSDGERHDEWRRLQARDARIVVGARSAVFAPLNDIGLIVVDEEHEPSYKQENAPRYHARDTAVQRARAEGAVVLLGSATPSLETFYAAGQGRIRCLEIPERIHNRPLPEVSVVDMREEFAQRPALFSARLVAEVNERLARRQQTILFLNRRGYASFVLCRDCGYVARCPHCAVSLTFHSGINALKCHHCDFGQTAPVQCPSCKGVRVRAFGIGTERVELEAERLFPGARIARLDRDTTARKGAHADILGRFRSGEADILIGTQMVAKGLDFPNVTLVGVISADTGINMPDFRAAERTFQLLTQVAGRAGRGEHPGSVVIQTFTPEHYSVRRATDQDYRGFYERELEFRRELRYPPFSRLANLVCTGDTAAAAAGRAGALAAALRQVLPAEVELIGPAPAPLARLKGIYRHHVVLRAPTDAPISAMVRDALDRLSAAERSGVTVDIDPVSMS